MKKLFAVIAFLAVFIAGAGFAHAMPVASQAVPAAGPSATTASPTKALVAASASARALVTPLAPPALFSVDSFRTSGGGSSAWLLVATALVLVMTVPGLALFCAGMVREKNLWATVMQGIAIAALITVIWGVVGYSFAFYVG